MVDLDYFIIFSEVLETTVPEKGVEQTKKANLDLEEQLLEGECPDIKGEGGLR